MTLLALCPRSGIYQYPRRIPRCRQVKAGFDHLLGVLFQLGPVMTAPPNDNFQNAPQACASALQAITTPASTRRTPFRHEGPTRCLYLNSKQPGHTKRPSASLHKKGHATLKDSIAYLLKFAPKEAYIDDLLNGRLYMNAAGYHHGLPGEQGDPLKASMAPGVCLYGYTCLPI